ncbi:MAG: ribosome-associated translation inhibitor RaiA [Melioribacteraceae bacterium]|nr:ribosome-associated translation inhibitor RaiA [Melioribacteraceae bacterium]MCF8352911.1 ribosome-associated translation inhibitor RaiA [Melioribacteraceae bacterium]MCF8395252.1 ribosome-associated translation inhibitor RaiA [Melioribacteraceae bacterium]MCF8417428.1 ribosome-associated translation inhibitor RaiA [Melioribacteraceae bacterium]
MNIQITSRKFRAKDTLKDYIQGELLSLQKFHDNILDADVVLSFTHLKDSIKTAEINLKIPGKILTVTETTENFEKSIGSAIGKLERQLKKVKAKRISRKKVK